MNVTIYNNVTTLESQNKRKHKNNVKDIYLNIIVVNAIIVVTQETHISSVIAINPPITTFLDFYIRNKNNVQMTCYSKNFLFR